MRHTLSAVLMTAACLVLQAETTGRIAGKVVNKAGSPVPGVKILLKRIDRNLTREITADAKGNFLQVGLDPKEYDLVASAEGYVNYQERIKIPLADQLLKNITLLTPEEARKENLASGALQAPPDDPGAAKDVECRENFNQAIPVYSEGKFAEALPLIDKAYKAGVEALATLKDEKSKADLAVELPKIERVLGICLAQAGENKADAEPYLLKSLGRNAKDERVLAGLVEASKAKGDKAAEQKYAGMLEVIQGPNADLIYNKGVEAFNAGKNAEAKLQLTKALEVDPKYAKAHYLLGMVEYGNMNLKGTKQHFLKYLEIAPTGDKAAEIKEMLRDPSLKNIK